jgi:hypothetical protein
MIDKELEERLQLLEKSMHERFDHVHLRHKRIENYLFTIAGLMLIFIVIVLFVLLGPPIPMHP